MDRVLFRHIIFLEQFKKIGFCILAPTSKKAHPGLAIAPAV